MPRTATLRRLASGFGFALLLAVALAFVVGKQTRRARDITRTTAVGATDAAGASVRPAGDTRELVLPLTSIDAHWWLLHAEQFAAQHHPVRHTDRDNPPAGRELHWSSSITLSLSALAAILGTFSGSSLRESLPLAALWLCPILLVLTLTGFAAVTWRRLGGHAAALLVAVLACAPGFTALFAPGEADHHGLAVAFALLSVWLLALARGERPWFAAAGVAGGLALWVSAFAAIPILLAIALGTVIETLLRRRVSSPDSTATPPPTNWSTWSRWGAATSLLFYALEYLPGHAGWRLEVNHPLHALAWWAGASALARLLTRLEKPPASFGSAREWLLIAAQAAAVLAPLALALFGGERFFLLGDPLLRALHADYIHEFRSLPSALADAGWLVLPVLWLAPFPAACLLFRTRRFHADTLAPVIRTFAPASVALVLVCCQIRWQGLATALCAALAITTWSALRDLPPTPGARRTRAAFAVFLVCACLQFPIIAWATRDRDHAPPNRAELASLVVRDVAWALHGVADPARAVVLSGPTTSTQLAYFGGFRVLGTLYWENTDGLRAAAAIFGLPDTDAALRLCQRHGITHLVLFSWDDFASAYARLHRLETGQTDASAPATGGLAALLAAGRIPRWLRPLAYDIPPALGLSDQRAMIYEIRPDQTSAEAVLNLALYQQEIGDLSSARATLTRGADLFAEEDESRRSAAELARALGDEALARRFPR